MALASPGWRERYRQAPVLGLFVVGLLGGSLLTATVLWVFSGLAEPLPVAARDAAVLGVAALAVLRDGGVLRVPLPQNPRQVPQEVLLRSWHRGALRFGFELGTGVRTFLSASAPYAVAAALLLGGPSLVGAALPAGLGFGAGRALAPLLRRASGDGVAWDNWLAARSRLLRIGCAVAVAVILGVLLLG